MRMERQHQGILGLPQSCVVSVLGWLTVEDVLQASMSCKAMHQLLQDELLWQNLAVAKWGPHVASLPPPACGWPTYCRKRLSLRTIKPSPLCLIQEAYPDPWQHIMCCVLCSRTSGSAVIVGAIQHILGTWPTPSAVLAAEEEALQQALHPLGLQDTRLAAIRSLSRDFLETDWQDPSEFKGCGPFVRDSWRIFCCGATDSSGVADCNLKRYLNWLRGASAGRVSSEHDPAVAEAAQAARKAAAAARAAARAAAAYERCANSSRRVTRGQLQQVLQESKGKAAGATRATDGAQPAAPARSARHSSKRVQGSCRAADQHAVAGVAATSSTRLHNASMEVKKQQRPQQQQGVKAPSTQGPSQQAGRARRPRNRKRVQPHRQGDSAAFAILAG